MIFSISSAASDQKIDQSQRQALDLLQRERRLHQRFLDHEQRNKTDVLPGRLHDELESPDSQRLERDDEFSGSVVFAGPHHLGRDGHGMRDRRARQQIFRREIQLNHWSLRCRGAAP